MIPRATPSCGSRQSIAHHTHREKCAPYIHFSYTNTNGFIQGNMLNTPQAVPLICKASVVQIEIVYGSVRIRNNERRMLMEYTQGLWVS